MFLLMTVTYLDGNTLSGLCRRGNITVVDFNKHLGVDYCVVKVSVGSAQMLWFCVLIVMRCINLLFVCKSVLL